MLKKLLGLLFGRWIIVILGLVAISILIWWLGPMFAFAGKEPLGPPLHRAIAIAVVWVLWLLRRVIRWLASVRINRDMLAHFRKTPTPEPEPTPDEIASQAELEELRGKFENSLELLKSGTESEKHGRLFLYQMPWYIIIGPPGCGKTTAIVNSGLRFPLGEGDAAANKVRGVGGTRNCDWWFTDEAVLIDTAGRYTTQDSQMPVDKAAWTGFLDLLKKYRKRRPINGALVAISIADLMQQTSVERQAHIAAIKHRLSELNQRLGVRFPVYLVFTKTDLLAGFIEFFDDLGREGRTQVWGLSFPPKSIDHPEQALEDLKQRWDLLEDRLNERLPQRLQQEKGQEQRDLIYGFPQQFSALRSTVESFVEAVFAPTRHETTPMLRGVYFTSGTQEGAPVDRLMSGLADTFGFARGGLERFTGRGRSYFINALFKDLIFPEASLAGTDLRVERRRAWLQRASYLAAAGVAGVLLLVWFTSYSANRNYVAKVQAVTESAKGAIAAQAAEAGRWTEVSVLPPLNELRRIASDYDGDGSWNLLMRFGLYQGGKLGSKANDAYRKQLANLLLPPLLFRLEGELQAGLGNRPEFLYETLKVYLMLDDPKHYDPEAIRAWFEVNWEQGLPRDVTAEQRSALGAHLDALLADPPRPLPLALDQSLIAASRAVLNRMTPAERVYARLKSATPPESVKDFSVSEASGRDASLIFVRSSGKPLSRGVPGLFTRAGYYDFVQDRAEDFAADLLADGWIYGVEATATQGDEPEQVAGRVLDLYSKDFISQWDEFLADVDIAPMASIREAVDVLNIASSAQSPIRMFLKAASEHSSLQRELPGKAGELVEEARTRLETVKDKLRKLLDDQEGPIGFGQPLIDPLQRVEDHFKDLRELTRENEDGVAPLDTSLALLEELFVYMQGVSSAIDKGAEALEAARSQGGPGGMLNRLRLESQRQPGPLDRWLRRFGVQTASLTVGSARGHVSGMMGSDVAPFCKLAIAGRFPVSKSSDQEITLEDFASFFGPGGVMDAFFGKFLEPFVDTAKRPWGWRAAGPSTLGGSRQTLFQFQTAARIRDMFFATGAPTPYVRFSLTPLDMDDSIQRFVLEIDGQQVRYSHGPARPTSLEWPGPSGIGLVRLEVSPPSSDPPSALTISGPWALFRLLSQSRLEPTQQPEKYRVTFRVGGRQASFMLTASSARNPFDLDTVQSFSCPEGL